MSTSNLSVPDATRNLARNIRTSGIYVYPDKIQFWLKPPLLECVRRRLERQCGKRLHLLDDPMPFNSDYIQRVQLRQPTQDELLFLAALPGLLLNSVELALDWTFADDIQRDIANELLNRYHVKLWHRNQELNVFKGTRYTGKRKAGNMLASYGDKECRITGEIYCLHLDWRAKRVGNLRRIGISSIGDLLTFNHYKFWKKRLLLKAVDIETLGRLNNIATVGKGRNRRKPWRKIRNGKIVFDYDRATGAILLQNAGTVDKGTRGWTQSVIDTYRKHLDIGKCLVEIDVEHLLPGIQRRKLQPKPNALQKATTIRLRLEREMDETIVKSAMKSAASGITHWKDSVSSRSRAFGHIYHNEGNQVGRNEIRSRK